MMCFYVKTTTSLKVIHQLHKCPVARWRRTGHLATLRYPADLDGCAGVALGRCDNRVKMVARCAFLSASDGTIVVFMTYCN